MAWRKTAAPQDGPAGYLAVFADELLESAIAGDERAAALLPAADSWLAMLRQAGGDPEIAELFCVFARGHAEQLWGQRDGVA